MPTQEDTMTTASVYTGFKILNSDQLFKIMARVGMTPRTVKKGRHITLRFRGDPRKLPTDMVGDIFSFWLKAVVDRRGVQVALLEPIEESVRALPWASAPHITLAHDSDVRPSTAKAVAREWLAEGVQEGDLTFEEGAVVVYGTLGFLHDLDGWLFHIPSDEKMIPAEVP